MYWYGDGGRGGEALHLRGEKEHEKLIFFFFPSSLFFVIWTTTRLEHKFLSCWCNVPVVVFFFFFALNKITCGTLSLVILIINIKNSLAKFEANRSCLWFFSPGGYLVQSPVVLRFRYDLRIFRVRFQKRNAKRRKKNAYPLKPWM